MRSTALFVTGGARAFNYTFCANHTIALSQVEQRLLNTLVRKTELRCHWWSKGFQLHLLCETQNCVVTGGEKAFNYTCCAKHRIAFILVLQWLSITRVVRSTNFRCDWWSNGLQLHLCETKNCVVTGVVMAFNFTRCAKHRIALSLLEERLSNTLVVRNTELRLHFC